MPIVTAAASGPSDGAAAVAGAGTSSEIVFPASDGGTPTADAAFSEPAPALLVSRLFVAVAAALPLAVGAAVAVAVSADPAVAALPLLRLLLLEGTRRFLAPAAFAVGGASAATAAGTNPDDDDDDDAYAFPRGSMLTLRVETGPLPEVEAASLPAAAAAAASPSANSAVSPPFQVSSKSTFHQPPAFLPTTVPRRPVSRRRTRVPAAISTLLVAAEDSSSDGCRAEASISVGVKLPDRRVLPRGGAAAGGSCCFKRRPSSDEERAQSGRPRCVVPLLLLQVPTLEVKPQCLARCSPLLRLPPLVRDSLRPLQSAACLPGLVLTKVSMAEEAEEGDNNEASPRRLKKNIAKNKAAV